MSPNFSLILKFSTNHDFLRCAVIAVTSIVTHRWYFQSNNTHCSAAYSCVQLSFPLSLLRSSNPTPLPHVALSLAYAKHVNVNVKLHLNSVTTTAFCEQIMTVYYVWRNACNCHCHVYLFAYVALHGGRPGRFPVCLFTMFLPTVFVYGLFLFRIMWFTGIVTLNPESHFPKVKWTSRFVLMWSSNSSRFPYKHS